MLDRKRRKISGFTLVELLVVLAILGMLAALVGPQVLNQLGGAKSKSAAIQIRDFEQALELYKLDVGRFPGSNEGLNALVRQPSSAKGWNGPYLKKDDVPMDPWGNPYQYRVSGSTIDISSYGADGRQGGSGEDADVSN
ncbi:MAG: type II secretion system protein GspG [Halieaceae bacterium]|jgi:general secretion pathway protein G|nr:MAG: type II secretion system protein GspG [Halieaceae bacterium]|tara:strand:+ start:44 stop:460 length:417 start_codon:yes stop_codon:yes gene_type:complete